MLLGGGSSVNDLYYGRGSNAAVVSVLQTPTIAPMTSEILLPSMQNAFTSIPTVEDYNDPSVENCIDSRTQWFIDPSGSMRVSSATAFLNSSVMSPAGHGVGNHRI